MAEEDIVAISHRHPMKAALELLLGHDLDVRQTYRSLVDIPSSRARNPRLVIVDVVGLLSFRPPFPPPPPRAMPDLLVVGLLEDSDAMIAAWNRGISALPLQDLKAETLARMAGRSRDGRGYYSFVGRRNAESVHGFLAKQWEQRDLAEREAAILDLVRRGYRNAEIGAALGIQEKTVRNRLTGIYLKLGVSGRHEVMAHFGER